ncbi:MAG: AAA family ATPase [Hungatella sp.]|nr:AAA family ATPase [Hungatella sp.]
MGMFVNPDNSAFQGTVSSEIYVDKTMLLTYTNKVLGTEQRYICNSRPRRFGKSITANMLTAYYSKGCDSLQLFAKTDIAHKKEYDHLKHLNKHDVIHFDVQWCYMQAGTAEGTVSYITKVITDELQAEFSDVDLSGCFTLGGVLARITQVTGRKFIVVIDEWDILVRDESANMHVQEEYINFLRSLFKGTEPSKFIYLAYLTGILPITKLKTESALNNFDEFTMLSSGPLAPYVGFTEEEVKGLCKSYGIDFDEVKRWYDGYALGGYHVYNPRAVVSAMMRGEFQSYWSQTGSSDAIMPLINMNFDGLKTAVISMLAGARVKVKTTKYKNNMVGFKSKDDVITALIHLGYFAYEQKQQVAFVPNEEIRLELEEILEETRWNELLEFQRRSNALLEATLTMDNDAVAEGIENIHDNYTSAIQYNDENSLSSVLTISYLSAMQYYFMPIREFPTGRGFADYVFIPKPEYVTEMPALVAELKWNKRAEAAIGQIKEKKYTQALEHYTGDILLVGVSYDKRSKKHECVIEKLKK